MPNPNIGKIRQQQGAKRRSIKEKRQEAAAHARASGQMQRSFRGAAQIAQRVTVYTPGTIGGVKGPKIINVGETNKMMARRGFRNTMPNGLPYRPLALPASKTIAAISKPKPLPQLKAPITGPMVARRGLAAKRAQRAQAKRNQQEGLGKGRATANLWSPHPSSWVEAIGYDEPTQTLMAVLSQVLYGWKPVPVEIYTRWVRAISMCRTWDMYNINRGLPPRWYKYKTPSLGATWHHGGIKQALAGKSIF